MSTPPHLEQAHPLRQLVEGLVREVAEARECSRVGMRTADKQAVLLGLARVAEQAGALKLAVLAEADDVAEQHATRTPGAWLARETRHDPRDGRAESKLARALDSRWGLVREAFADGRLNQAQVEAIVQALDGCPARSTPTS